MNLGPAEAVPPTCTLDRFLDGLVTLVQPSTGHRAGLDAALLQAIVPSTASGTALDVGSGVGTIAFAVAARAPRLSVIGLERDPDLVACAEVALCLPENAGFAARVRLVQADVADRRAPEAAGLGERSAEWVLMNPPFDQTGRVRPSPDPGRRDAHLGEAGALAAWCRTAAVLLKPGGMFGLIHRAAALPEVLAAIGNQFGEVRVLPVHPFAGRPARRVAVRARRESRAPLELMPSLVLHEAGGAWTPTAEAILRGRAELPL